LQPIDFNDVINTTIQNFINKYSKPIQEHIFDHNLPWELTQRRHATNERIKLQGYFALKGTINNEAKPASPASCQSSIISN
jgi:hypothetical protein